MINPDAKCVVNGSKLNEAIIALNPLLAMDIITGNVAQPVVKYGESSVQIVIPSGVVLNEELDIVGPNNTATSRFFATGTSGGSSSSGATVETSSPVNGSNPSQPKPNRDSLNIAGAGAPQGAMLDIGGLAVGGGNRGINGGNTGGGVNIDNGPWPPAVPGGQPTDEFGNVIGSGNLGMPIAPKTNVNGQPIDSSGNVVSPSGALRDTGSDSGSGGQPNLPGAPPPNAQVEANKKEQQDSQFDSYMSNLIDKMAQARTQLSRAKKADTQKFNPEKNRWEYKRFGDPDSPTVQVAKERLKTLKAEYERAKNKRE